ncbi:MAG TPA: SpoIIE family protein phosphatase [Terriglobia bacterium]|nr:SpoIIE family protein phosphatase [Terriglobia bacterium]
MQFRVNFKSGRPVYLQVMDQVKAAAASGALRLGEALPSVGTLAGELRVNRNAVSKAYSELERLGVIEMQPGGEYFLKERQRESRQEVRRTTLALPIDESMLRGPAVLKTALRYGLLAILLGAVFLAPVVLGGGAVLGLAMVAAVFLPLRSLAGKVAYGIVFARRFEFPRLLRIIKWEAASQPDLGSFIERVIERTEQTLGARLEFIHDRAAVMSLVHSFPALRAARAPVSAGADFLMPVFSDEEVLGLLRLTPKSTGEEYDAEDLEFLAAVSEQVAIAANQFRIRSERQESEYALDIQRGLLPREIPQAPGFTIASAWQPAKMVGGDYYDVFKLSETQLALVVADVSGKGMPAALLMSNLQATAKAYATLESSPRGLCDKVNRAVCKSIPSAKFVTFFYAVLDLKGQRLTYTNAGHNPPIIAGHDGACRRLETGGTVLGLFADANYEQAGADLLPGDRLVMFTDGISEAADMNGQEFGEERLIALMKERREASAADLRDAVMQEVTQFCRGDFADDATLLIVAVGQPA